MSLVIYHVVKVFNYFSALLQLKIEVFMRVKNFPSRNERVCFLSRELQQLERLKRTLIYFEMLDICDRAQLQRQKHHKTNI